MPVRLDSPFRWTPARREAVELLAQGELGPGAVAGRLDVSETALNAWRRHPVFQAELDRIRGKRDAALRAQGILIRAQRLGHYRDRHTLLEQVIAARAADPDADAPGADTGLLVRTFRTVGGQQSAQVVEEWAVDTGLLRELRELEQQASKELGEWQDRSQVELTGPGGGPVLISTFRDALSTRLEQMELRLQASTEGDLPDQHTNGTATALPDSTP